MTNPVGTCCKITQNDQSVSIAVDFFCSSGQTKMPCWAKPPLTFFGSCGTAYLYMLKQIRGAAVQLWPIRAGVVRLKICSGKSQPLFSQNIRLFLWLWGPCRIYNQPCLHSDPRERKKKQEFGERERERERDHLCRCFPDVEHAGCQEAPVELQMCFFISSDIIGQHTLAFKKQGV